MKLRAAALMLALMGCSHAPKPPPEELKGPLLPWPVPDLDIARAVATGEPPSFLLEFVSPDAAWSMCPLDPPSAKPVADSRRTQPKNHTGRREVFTVSKGLTLARATPADLEESIYDRGRSIKVTPICGRKDRVAFSVSTYRGMEPDTDSTLVMIRVGDSWMRESMTHSTLSY
ncbi:MAG: hypothetical protein JST54_02470 [Deltaproteobacteria bacterium]|nr:hypothetical protein [Deltaproteobacteria bacterium]